MKDVTYVSPDTYNWVRQRTSEGNLQVVDKLPTQIKKFSDVTESDHERTIRIGLTTYRSCELVFFGEIDMSAIAYVKVPSLFQRLVNLLMGK